MKRAIAPCFPGYRHHRPPRRRRLRAAALGRGDEIGNANPITPESALAAPGLVNPGRRGWWSGRSLRATRSGP